MPGTAVNVAALIGCSLAGIGGARLVGSHLWLGSGPAGNAPNDWAHAVHEGDAPPSPVGQAGASRPGTPDPYGIVELDGPAGIGRSEIVELHVRRYDRPR